MLHFQLILLVYDINNASFSISVFQVGLFFFCFWFSMVPDLHRWFTYIMAWFAYVSCTIYSVRCSAVISLSSPFFCIGNNKSWFVLILQQRQQTHTYTHSHSNVTVIIAVYRCHSSHNNSYHFASHFSRFDTVYSAFLKFCRNFPPRISSVRCCCLFFCMFA